MSTVEVQGDGVKFPTWAVGVVFAIVMSWMGWMSLLLINTKTELVELRTQVRSTSVPEGTERALQELRIRMNGELAGRDALSKLATENAKDIGYLMKELEITKSDVRRNAEGITRLDPTRQK